MNRRLNDPDWRPDPYEAPWTAWEPPGPLAAEPENAKKTLSITHSLTDDELRRFVDFDVFFDPMPMLGFISQWVLMVSIFGAAGVISGLALSQSMKAMMIGGLMVPSLGLSLFHVAVTSRRRLARALGLCEGRIVTISAQGISIQIPAAQLTSMPGIGQGIRSWSDIRKISVTKYDLIFWMQPHFPDLEGRARIVVPLRAFANPTVAADFENAARRWHAVASGGDTHWWDEANV